MGLNDFEDKSLNAKFYVRILSSLDFATDSIKIEANEKTIHIKSLQKNLKLNKEKKETFWCFNADKILWNRTQDNVYATITENFVDNILKGISGIILAYGQTGSGKTFTVSGLRYHYENRGLILRLLSALWDECEAYRDSKKISISMSYVEFIKTEMRDLLADKPVEKFKDIKKNKITDEMEGWKSIFEAENRRSVSNGAPYPGSHKGHTVLTFYIELLSLIDSHPVPALSKVHIIDMSGIDSAGDQSATWKSCSDQGYSNLTKSLMEQLILCINGKTWKASETLCPYKSTKLLDFLQDTLHPRSMIRFVAHIIGNNKNLPITLSVLRFGEQIKGFKSSQVEIFAADVDPAVKLQELEKEVDQLRAELDLNGMINDSFSYSTISQEKIQQTRRAVKNFLLGNIEKLTLISIGQTELTLDVFREVYERMTQEKEQAVTEAVIAAIEEVQSQLVHDRTHAPPLIPANQGKISRRRGSRYESQISLIPPVKSSETSETGTQKSISQVGILDKKGITVGLGKMYHNEDSVLVKALKRTRSRRSDNVLRPVVNLESLKDKCVMTVSKEFSNEESHVTLPERLPSKEEAWAEFVAEKGDIIRFHQEQISILEENAQSLKKKYTTAICELSKLKNTLQKIRSDWQDWNHIQEITKTWSEEEGYSFDKDESKAKFYIENIRKKEQEVENAVENCHVTLIDFRNIMEELSRTKAALENEFQIFCGETYQTPMIPEDFSFTELEFEKSTETFDNYEAINQIRMEMYLQFQQKMMKYVPKVKKSKWISLF